MTNKKATARLTAADSQAKQAKRDRKAEAAARRADRLAGIVTEIEERQALYSNVGR